MRLGRSPVTLVVLALLSAGLTSCSQSPAAAAPSIPRTADGKPDLQGIWQVRNRAAVDLVADAVDRDPEAPGRIR